MMKFLPAPIRCLAFLAIGLVSSAFQAQAIQIDLTNTYGNHSDPQANRGNTRSYSAGGINLQVRAQSLIGHTAPWEDSYLGRYGGGLGVINRAEGSGSGNKHTVDNIGSTDRVIFIFDTPVVLDRLYLGYVVDDSDLTIYSGDDLTTLAFLEHNTIGHGNARWADINNGDPVNGIEPIAATHWTVSAYYPRRDNEKNDEFKIQFVEFSEPTNVPDSGPTLILLLAGLSSLRLAKGVGGSRKG